MNLISMNYLLCGKPLRIIENDDKDEVFFNEFVIIMIELFHRICYKYKGLKKIYDKILNY